MAAEPAAASDRPASVVARSGVGVYFACPPVPLLGRRMSGKMLHGFDIRMAEILLATLVGCLLAVPAAVAASILAQFAFIGVMHLVPNSGWLPYALFAVGIFAYVTSYFVAGLGVPVAVVGAVWPGQSPAIGAGAGAAVALVWRVVRKDGVG